LTFSTHRDELSFMADDAEQSCLRAGTSRSARALAQSVTSGLGARGLAALSVSGARVPCVSAPVALLLLLGLALLLGLLLLGGCGPP
jgi:hypothetical protein